MSHFTVLVIGDNPEELLAPFDEGIEVEPRDDEQTFPAKAQAWAQKVASDPDDYRRSYKYRKPEQIDAQLAEYSRMAALDPNDAMDAAVLLDWYHSSGRWYRKENGEYWTITTYNPESKWDWYALGGRWRGSLKLKEESLVAAAQGKTDATLGEKSWVFEPQWNDGKEHEDDLGWVDQCRKGDLDLEGMKAKNRAVGERAIANLIDFISEKGNPPSLAWMDEDTKAPGWQEKKDAFWQSSWVKEFNERCRAARTGPEEERHGLGLSWGGWWDLEDFRLVTENVDGAQRFVTIQEARSIPGYALLDKEHGWMAPGDMGWFGMSSDDQNSRIGYYEARLAIVTALPDDALLSVYDCHI
jgi:hypothetical protein